MTVRDEVRNVMHYPIRDLNKTVGKTPVFYADYAFGIDAYTSKGNHVGTMEVATSPRTYIDDSGIMQLITTQDTARFSRFFYNQTGLQEFDRKIIFLEKESTNYLIHSIFDTDGGGGLASGWSINTDDTISDTTTLIDISALFDIGTNVNSQRIQGTFVGDGTFYNVESDNTAVGSFVQNDVVTVSFYLKGEVSGLIVKLECVEKDAAGVDGTNHASSAIESSLSSTDWKKFTLSFTCADADASRLSSRIVISSLDASDTVDIQIANAQVEKKEYTTSLIPTTTTALTRLEECLSYDLLDNLPPGECSIVIEYFTFFNNTNVSDNYLFDTDTKRRVLYFPSGTDDIYAYPNLTDSSTSSILDLINESFSSYEIQLVGVNMQHSNPYVRGYYQGAHDGTDEAVNDYTNNVWNISDKMYIGNKNDCLEALDGGITRIWIYNEVLTDEEMAEKKSL